MDTMDLLQTLRNAGYTVKVIDGDVWVKPAPTPEARRVLAEHKPEIMELAHSLDDLIDAWRRGPRTDELGEKLKAASLLQPVVRHFEYETEVSKGNKTHATNI